MSDVTTNWQCPSCGSACSSGVDHECEKAKARSVEFTVPGDVYARLSPNLRISGWTRGRRVQNYRYATWVAWHNAGEVKLRTPVRVTFTVRRARSADSDNLDSALKCVRDGLTAWHNHPEREAMLPDDSQNHIAEAIYRQETGAQWKGHECVHIRVEEIER